jgi:hypothetical protein
MRTITVTHQRASEYLVTVADERSSSAHVVTAWPSDVEHYAPGAAPEELIEASFEFLLAREPKESILTRFELPVIERYFPEYASTIAVLVESHRDPHSSSSRSSRPQRQR